MNRAKITVLEILSKPYLSKVEGCWIVDCMVDFYGNTGEYRRAFAYEYEANELKVGDSWGE